MQTNKISTLIQEYEHKQAAAEHGSMIHAKLQYLFSNTNSTDKDIINILEHINSDNTLQEYFGALSKTEVPVAGYINDLFISRRIDRLYINHQKQYICIIDYKSDTTKDNLYTAYCKQLKEYHKLISDIYPNYKIECKILWLNDFTLEQII